MNCLNRYEIQRYIDNEVSPNEMTEFEKHLETCAECSTLFISSKKEISTLKQIFTETELSDQEIVVPEFMYPRLKTNKRMWIISLSAAASLLLALGIFLIFNHHSAECRLFTKSELEVERYLYQSDPNRLWNEKQPIITVTDGKGEIIYSSIND